VHGELLVLDVKVAASTVWEILKDAGIDPVPERAGSMWTDFLRSQAHALLACDFLASVTLIGMRRYVLAVIEHRSLRDRVLGATAHPTASWVTQAARNLVMDLEEAGCTARFLIRDRDGKFPGLFDTVWNQRHLLRALREFEASDNEHRPHRRLGFSGGPFPGPARHGVGAVPQNSLDSSQECGADLHRVGEAAFGHRAVSQYDEMPACELGLRLPELCEQSSDGVQEPLAVGADGLVYGMLGIRILRDGVEKGASAEAGRLDTVGDRPGDGPQDVGGRPAAAEGLADLIAIGLVDGLQIRDDEVFLTGEVPVQRRAGHFRLRDDPVDPDGVDPFGVEEPGGGVEQPRSRFGNLTSRVVCHRRVPIR
jgi:hypothetical protein